MTASTSVARGKWEEKKMTTDSKPDKEESVVLSEVVYKLDWVIFPDNKWIKIWDLVVLVCLFCFTFILPYQIGVSAGYSLLVNIPWLVVNVIMNAVFFVDTFLAFFRAYRTKEGQLVFSLRKIQRRYLRTYFIPNFLSVLPFTIAFYAIAKPIVIDDAEGNSQQMQFLSIIMFGSLLKLIRLVRVRSILSSSDVVTNFRIKHNSQVIQLWSYVLRIVIGSHWFACIWCFVALCETRTFREGGMTNTPNWIGNWYNETGQEGGLNPIGMEQATDRYVLSLFWAIQTITSIGYGNIAPVTAAEWWIGCFLQLCAGVMWAYVIGGLVSVAAGMQAEAELYRNRIDHANELIHQFDGQVHPNKHDDPHTQDILDSKDVAKRIRLYVHKQFKLSGNATCASTFSDEFPVFDTLTPELQHMSSILISRKYLELVPYLSSQYLSTNDQSQVAMKCVVLEFAAGEIVQCENCMEGLGRGIFVMRSGCAWAVRNTMSNKEKANFFLLTTGMTFGTGKVLLEDDHPASRGTLQFLTFSRVMFIPRSAALAAMNKRAWKECGRWRYLKTLLSVSENSGENGGLTSAGLHQK